jgi:hypothetical protein
MRKMTVYLNDEEVEALRSMWRDAIATWSSVSPMRRWSFWRSVSRRTGW